MYIYLFIIYFIFIKSEYLVGNYCYYYIIIIVVVIIIIIIITVIIIIKQDLLGVTKTTNHLIVSQKVLWLIILKK